MIQNSMRARKQVRMNERKGGHEQRRTSQSEQGDESCYQEQERGGTGTGRSCYAPICL